MRDPHAQTTECTSIAANAVRVSSRGETRVPERHPAPTWTSRASVLSGMIQAYPGTERVGRNVVAAGSPTRTRHWTTRALTSWARGGAEARAAPVASLT